MGDQIKIIMYLDKDKFDAFVEKFNVEEYTVNTKKCEVTIAMAHLFDAAAKQYDKEMQAGEATHTSGLSSL